MAPRPLRGARYLPDTTIPDLPQAIAEVLPNLDMKETLEFYEAFRRLNPAPADHALLACNDLFYLFAILCDRRDACHPWIFNVVREVEGKPNGCLDLWSRGHYKDLDSLTPVLTTNGWKTHGSLVPGDTVFCPDGSTSRVVATRHFTDAKCYRMTFCNGVTLVAGAGHLWPVDLTSKKRVPGTWKNGVSCGKRIGREQKLLTTDDLYRRLKEETYRPALRTTQPLRGVESDLPVDPYVLGAWLGDGFSRYGAICGIDHEIFHEIERRGYAIKMRGESPDRHPDYRVVRVEGLTAGLRRLNLVMNKHIPECYLTAPEEARRDLLWGLIDTDGSVGKANACVTFANTNRRLIDGVVTLAASLGYKPRVSPARTTNSWHVTFVATARDLHPPCWLPRKRAMLQDKPRHLQSQSWYITEIKPIETVATNCIQIEDPRGLYLVGRQMIPTHNSSIITFALTIQDILVDPEQTFGIFSFSRATAQTFLAQIKAEFERNKILKVCFPDVLYWAPEKESPRWSLQGGILVKRRSNPKEATVEAWGLVEGTPTGRHFKNLVFDDMIEQRNVTNPEQIAKATEAWELSDNLGVGDGTIKRYVGTRYALGDTYQTMIDRKVVHVRLKPATDNGRIDGNPVFWTKETWEKKKIEQRATLPAQLLQNPAAGKQSVFELAWMRPYEIRPSILNVYIMGDPSRGRTVRSDRTAIAVVGIDTSGNKYLLDGVRHRMNLSQRWNSLKNLHAKWSGMAGVQNVQVGYERFGQQSDDEYFMEQMQRLPPNEQFAIEELAWPNEGKNSKGDRVQRLQPDFQTGKFLLPPVVFHPDIFDEDAKDKPWTQKIAYWKYNPDTFLIDYWPYKGPTRNQRKVIALGQQHLVPQPIMRMDEDDHVYDVTRALIEEMGLFPFAPHDDLVDAVSRIYDMTPTPATLMERVLTNPADYPDA